MIQTQYDPRQYWDARLASDFTLTGVGHKCYSADYNRWNHKAHERALTRLLNHADVRIPGCSVLDAGSGTGYWLDWYQRRGAVRITALELSLYAVDRLRTTHPGVEVLEADITGRMPELAPFDIVNVQGVMYHVVEPAAFERAMENVARLVRPGGCLILSDRLGTPNQESDVVFHCRFRALERYEKALPRFGLRIERVESVSTLLDGGLQNIARWPHWRIERLVHLGEETLAPALYLLDGLPILGRWANMRMLLASKSR